MAEVKQVRTNTDNEVVVDRAKDFWGQYSKPIIVGGAILLLVVGGWFGYKNFIQEPKEQKAAEAIFKAEEYYRQDSLKLALSGDGQYAGFEKIISQYGGTKAGNMAKFYAGSIYLQQGNFTKAISNLEDFDTDALQIKARAYKLLADAYADAGKNNDAFEHYKKAATTFEDDATATSEYLFMAAYFADRVLNKKDEAVTLYKDLKKKYPQSQFAGEADRFLAQAGVYNVE
ncbi:MAG: tetratricopeptide repeat protein [Bacteroidota bacterium]